MFLVGIKVKWQGLWKQNVVQSIDISNAERDTTHIDAEVDKINAPTTAFRRFPISLKCVSGLSLLGESIVAIQCTSALLSRDESWTTLDVLIQCILVLKWTCLLPTMFLGCVIAQISPVLKTETKACLNNIEKKLAVWKVGTLTCFSLLIGLSVLLPCDVVSKMAWTYQPTAWLYHENVLGR